MPKKQLPGVIHDVDLRRLRVFRAVVERKGITAAEADLNIGRSTISIHISDLEKRLNMALFDRIGSGLQLTEEGEAIYKASLQLVDSLELFRDQIIATRDGLGGEIKLGYMDQLSSHPKFNLVTALRRFHITAPKVRVSLEITPMDLIERGVMSGDLDIGIVVGHRELSGLDYRDYIIEEQGLYCGFGHPLFNRPSSELNWNIIDSYDRVGQKYVRNKENIRAHFNSRPMALAHSAEAIAHHVLSGHYIGALPVHYANQWMREGTMRRLLLKEFTSSRQLRVIRKKGAASERISMLFLDTLFRAN